MRRILITGANKGIGFATAEAILANHGDVTVIIGARDVERGQASIEKLCEHHPARSSRLELLHIDIADDHSVIQARDTVVKRHGIRPNPLYGLVNNAGIGLGSNELDTVVNINTLGAKRVCDAFIPLIESGGRIVNVSSASGPKFVTQCARHRHNFFQNALVEWEEIEHLLHAVLSKPQDAQHFHALGLGEIDAYGFSKACLNLYTMALARQRPDLLINACTPGYIETDLTRPLARSRGASPASLGMKSPQHGTVAILFLLFDAVQGTGHYFGSDAKRSPLGRYRAPGSAEYQGD